MEPQIELGKRYRDSVSGEEGIAISQTRQLDGPDRAYLRWDDKARYKRPGNAKHKGNTYDVSKLERVDAPAAPTHPDEADKSDR